jgi:hypothetical protein
VSLKRVYDSRKRAYVLPIPNYAAVHVRGVRPAPSSYTNMISRLYSAQVNARAAADPSTAEVRPPQWPGLSLLFAANYFFSVIFFALAMFRRFFAYI